MELSWSWHALDRAQQMGLDPLAVESAVRCYTHSYPNPPHHPSGRVYVAGSIAVAVADDGTIMTILWAGRTGRAA